MFFIKEIRQKNCNLNEKVMTKAKFNPASSNHKPSALHTELLPDLIFRCRTTKLLSQKRRHLAVFCISFLWQRRTRPEKRRRLLPQKKRPSSCILHWSNRIWLLWLRPNSRIHLSKTLPHLLHISKSKNYFLMERKKGQSFLY